jgi:protein ImuB
VALPRLACIAVSLFPLAARLRSEPELAREAVVIVEGNGSAARVLAASRLARRAGVRPGLTLPQARALIPKLVARPRDAECERAAQEALLEIAERFSPRIEDAGEGVAYLDADGIDRRFRPAGRAPRSAAAPPAGATTPATPTTPITPATPAMPATPATPASPAEMSLACALAGAAEAAGLPARVGIASSKLAARIAATLAESPAIVPAGEEAAFLAPLPLARLLPTPETLGTTAGAAPGAATTRTTRATGGAPAHPGAAGILDIVATLAQWGIKTIGDFARLPVARVTSRLGSSGRELHATARGIDPRPLMPSPPPPAFHEGMDLEWPLVALEPFLFVCRAALERLCLRLEANGLACARLELTLRLEPEGHQPRTIDLPAPTRDVKTLLTLLRLDLEARPPGAPVAGFTLAAHPDRPREAQLALYGPAALSPDKLAATLARLFALLGPGRIGSPRPVDGHRPERLALVEYAPPPPPLSPEARRDLRSTAGRGLLAVRVVRPATEIEVLVHDPRGPRDPRDPRGPRSPECPEASGGTAARTSPAPATVQPPETPEISEPSEPSEPSETPGPPEIPDPPETAEPCLLAPVEIRPVTREDTAGRLRVTGRVKVAAGPWGLEDEWWTPNPTGRDYWDVELTTGGIYRIFRDRASGAWYVDGVYD